MAKASEALKEELKALDSIKSKRKIQDDTDMGRGQNP